MARVIAVSCALCAEPLRRASMRLTLSARWPPAWRTDTSLARTSPAPGAALRRSPPAWPTQARVIVTCQAPTLRWRAARHWRRSAAPSTGAQRRRAERPRTSSADAHGRRSARRRACVRSPPGDVRAAGSVRRNSRSGWRLTARSNTVVVDQRRRRLGAPNDPLYGRRPGRRPGPGGRASGTCARPAATVQSAINVEAAWGVTHRQAGGGRRGARYRRALRPRRPAERRRRRQPAARLRHDQPMQRSPTTATGATPMPPTRATWSPRRTDQRPAHVRRLRESKTAPGTAPRWPA